MAAQEIVMAIVAIRESIQLITDIANLWQASAGVTDEQVAQAQADAAAAHNELQNTP